MSDTTEKTEFEKMFEKKLAESNSACSDNESVADDAAVHNDSQIPVDNPDT